MNTLEWLSRLIAFDTTSRNSNLPLIKSVQDELVKQGVDCRITLSQDKQKANLLATIPAANGDLTGGVVLSGHTDVVPVDGQQWDTDPFVATQKEGRVYGRGTCDMKGFVAVMLGLVPTLLKTKLTQPVRLAFSYDEEVGCKGVPALIEDLQQQGFKPNVCIVGEPTNMRPVIAHKGIQLFSCRLQGRAAHSSLTPMGCNAIEYAARLINHIRGMAERMRQQGPFDTAFDVPFTTISVNKIQGGIARNIIPESCEFTFEFRHLPEVQPQLLIDDIMGYIQNELLPAMQSEFPTASIEMEKIGAAPSFESLDEAVVSHWTLEDKQKVSYATEAGFFQRAGIPTFVCGPGSIEQAHRPNEFVTLQQLTACEAFLKKVLINT